MFYPQIEYFGNDYNLLVWDAPAHGRSRPYCNFTYPDAVDRLHEILIKEHMDNIFILGHSAGGFVAQFFYWKYPKIVKGFMTIGTCPCMKSYFSKTDIFWLRQTEWMANLFPDKLLRKEMAIMCGVTKAGIENMTEMIEPYSKKELCHLMYLGFAGFVDELRDEKINCPVCLMVGEHDHTGKVRKYTEEWHKRDDFPLYIIGNAAHNANVDNPTAVNKVVENFIKESI